MPDLTTLAFTALLASGQVPSTDATAAQTIFLDPMTGEIVDRPPRGVDPGDSQLLRPVRSDAGLVEEVLPDGSVMIDLQGRFQSVMEARIVNGRIVLRHAAATAEPDDANR
ncbi:MAG: hypothetical protein AAGE01_23885 [Pseudomonadota bacterium]